jgi:tyrosyl-DNA phosphodiesterase-1
MTQGAWLSPMLPTLSANLPHVSGEFQINEHAIGTGERFKADLLVYLQAYESRCVSLRNELAHFDFSSIRGALVSSTPSRVELAKAKPKQFTAFGWVGLQQVLKAIPPRKTSQSEPHASDNVILQVSSIATLGTNWEQDFFDVLRTSRVSIWNNHKPRIKILYPCVKDIQVSLNGYASGGSIHMKSQTSNMRAQIERFKELFVCWCHDFDDPDDMSSTSPRKQNALRQEAAPHIKTYVRLNSSYDSITWALLTSANLSKQAWGEVHNKKTNHVSIASYEIGVLVWPELFQKGCKDVRMVPVFGRDDVDSAQSPDMDLIPLRMPYSLPLREKKPHLHGEPWTTDQKHNGPDRLGNLWRP